MAQINGSTAQLPSHFAYYIIWEETDVNVANNTSVVTAYVYVQKVGSYNVQSANNNHYLYIDGTGFNANNYVDMNPETTPRLLVSGSKTITHNADGSKSITISASGDICKISGATYSPQSGSGSATVSLTTIPRRATLSGNADLTIGNNKAYSLTNNGALYVRMEYWILGNGGWYRVKNQNNGTGTSGTFTMSADDNNAMYSRMPNVTSASAIMRAYTYSDASYTTQVGDYHDVNGTVSINTTTNKPTFTDYAVANVDKSVEVVDKYSNSLVTSSTSTLLGSDSKMIKGYSKLRATISTANKMVALNYATNVKYRFVAGAKQTEANYSADSTVTIDIDNATTKDVSVLAIDSRSLSTSVAKSLDYLADYTPISIWGLTLVRDNGVDDGTKLQISGKLWKEYFGGGTSGVLNTVTAHYRYKETTESWSAQTWNAITLTDDGSGNLSYDDYVNGDLGASGFDPEKSYNVEVRVFDKLSQMIVESTLSVGVPVMHMVRQGISLGARYDSAEGGNLQVMGRNIFKMLSNSFSRQSVINGNFDIWQRGISFTISPATVTYTADRWRTYTDANGGTLPTITVARGLLSSGELEKSFYYNRLTMNGAGSSLGNNATVEVGTNIENGTRFLCGDGKKLTLTFWARSSIANKTLGVKFIQYYGSGGSPTTQEVLSDQGQAVLLTSSWQKYTIEIETNTLSGKTFGTNNDDFFRFFFSYYWGSTRNAEMGGNATTNMANGTVDIAQIQLVAGDKELPFFPRDFREELSLCQRYYQKGFNYGTTPANNSELVWRTSLAPAGSYCRYNYVFPVEMRTTPVLTLYGVSSSNWDYFNGSWQTMTTNYYWTTNKYLDVELVGVASVGVWLIRGQWTANADF